LNMGGEHKPLVVEDAARYSQRSLAKKYGLRCMVIAALARLPIWVRTNELDFVEKLRLICVFLLPLVAVASFWIFGVSEISLTILLVVVTLQQAIVQWEQSAMNRQRLRSEINITDAILGGKTKFLQIVPLTEARPVILDLFYIVLGLNDDAVVKEVESEAHLFKSIYYSKLGTVGEYTVYLVRVVIGTPYWDLWSLFRPEVVGSQARKLSWAYLGEKPEHFLGAVLRYWSPDTAEITIDGFSDTYDFGISKSYHCILTSNECGNVSLCSKYISDAVVSVLRTQNLYVFSQLGGEHLISEYQRFIKKLRKQDVLGAVLLALGEEPDPI